MTVSTGLDACHKSSHQLTTQSPIRFYTELGSFNVQSSRTFNNGEIVLVGSSGSAAAILVLDAEGNSLWSHLLESNGESVYRDVIQHPNGSYIVVGSTNSSDLANSGAGQDGILVAYQNGSSNPKINRLLSKYDVDLMSLTLLSDGDIIVVGKLHQSSYRSMILRINSNLDKIWESDFSVGPWHSYALEALESTPGECIILGYRSFSDTEVNKFSTYFMRLNAKTGTNLGTKSYLDHTREYLLSTVIRDRIRMAKTKDGICWATTEEQPGLIITTHWVRTNMLGEVMAEKRITGLGDATTEWMHPLQDGSYLILGASDDKNITTSNIGFRFAKYMMMNVDQDGNELWSSYLGDEKQLQFALGANESYSSLNIVGMMQQISSGFRHPCFFQVDHKGKILDERPH
ncbi:MAG: hypothetical protein GC180_03760 [Bacteroidetes bacterium]|nr:hypothetical protein [Bacteroidota bacterium]